MSTQFDHVTISKHANIYFDGKCVSYNLSSPDNSKKIWTSSSPHRSPSAPVHPKSERYSQANVACASAKKANGKL